MATLRELKTRIGSVSSSEKITGAMKMISSAKVHKFEQSLRKLLPFKEQIQSIMGHILASDTQFSSPLIEVREANRIGLVVFGSDDGLCGAYNVNIFKYVLRMINEMRSASSSPSEIVLYPVGRKMHKALSKIEGDGISIVEMEGVDSKMEGKKVNDFTLALQDEFLSGNIDKVSVVYMNFKSMAKQIVRTDQLFPVDHLAVMEGIDSKKNEDNKLYIFEPDANSIFNEVLPMFVLSTMQEVTIENRASEQAARVMAMQSANDNAKKLLEELQLEYNKLRQQSITTELLDILGGQVQK